MNPDNRKNLRRPLTRPTEKLRVRVVSAAEGVLARQGFVSAIDVLLGMGWLDQGALKRWKQSQLEYLEAGIQTNLSRISEAMRLFRAWATEKHLYPSETAYVAKTPARTTLRFSKSGDATIERLYRTHWVSQALSEKKRERIKEAQSRPPELVVIQPLDADWKCHRCGGSGDFLIVEEPGPSCLTCAGLGALVFLPAGDAGRSRRAKASSDVHAVVVRFSRKRKRYERQGLLVQPEALHDADGSGVEGAAGSRMSSVRRTRRRTSHLSEARLAEMIEEATVDAYGESEQTTGWFTMIDENLTVPFETMVLGVQVRVERIELDESEHIVAICRRGRVRQAVPILDLPLPTPPPAGADWIEAYRQWSRGMQ